LPIACRAETPHARHPGKPDTAAGGRELPLPCRTNTSAPSRSAHRAWTRSCRRRVNASVADLLQSPRQRRLLVGLPALKADRATDAVARVAGSEPPERGTRCSASKIALCTVHLKTVDHFPVVRSLAAARVDFGKRADRTTYSRKRVAARWPSISQKITASDRRAAESAP